MIGYILVFMIWSLAIFFVGMKLDDNLNDGYIKWVEKECDFHKDQKEITEEAYISLRKQNHNLKERNAQLINENKKLKKELDKQNNTTYNIFY